MAMQIPQNYWFGNQFMMPPLTGQGYRQPPGLIDLAPKVDSSGILATSGVQMPSFVTEGTGRNQGPGEAGLGRGPAEYGLEAGKSATADTTTAASTDWADVAKMAMLGAVPGISTLMSVTGMTERARNLAREYAEAMGLAPAPQSAVLASPGYDPSYSPPPGTVDYDLEGSRGQPGGGGLSDLSRDPTAAGNQGEAASESPGLYSKGGPVMAGHLIGPDPPGPDQGMGGLMGGEFVVNAKAAKKHRGILDAINAGASKAKLRGLLG